MLISIIIPVYKTEQYLKRCIESVLAQTHQDLEIILVNDGSPDNSLKICYEYAEMDRRIKVVNKENGGVASARNAGIDLAAGEYIGFVDSDDYIEPDMFELLVGLINEYKADISICGCYVETSGGLHRVRKETGDILVLDRHRALELMFSYRYYRGYLCNKLFKASLFKENKIRLDENITLCEDLLCVCRCMLESKRVVYLDLPKYHYNMHNQCYTLAPFSESKMTALDAFSQIKEMIAGTSRKTVDAFYGLFVGINVSLMALDPGGLNKETASLLRRNIRNHLLTCLRSSAPLNIKLNSVLISLSPGLYYFILTGVRGVKGLRSIINPELLK